eukprot:TRINITY_DN10076_c0_g1_i1.p1 TRINITY_DN10076_c0_g1~~TRINITY_DN10076_c0_g1_i1.p1  ORF type:complete len:129 (-),score=15.54 TRINITY_DN10076_c0_g1_i1:4-390(-)
MTRSFSVDQAYSGMKELWGMVNLWHLLFQWIKNVNEPRWTVYSRESFGGWESKDQTLEVQPKTHGPYIGAIRFQNGTILLIISFDTGTHKPPPQGIIIDKNGTVSRKDISVFSNHANYTHFFPLNNSY